MSNETERELLSDVGLLLLKNSGRTGKRARLMRQVAAWLATLADIPSQRELDDLREQLAEWDR